MMSKWISILFLEFFQRERRIHVIRHRRIWIPHLRQIRRPRFRFEEVEHRVIPLLLLELRHAAVLISDIAKYNRARRTSLLARGLDRAIRNHHVAGLARLDLLRNLRTFDAL